MPKEVREPRLDPRQSKEAAARLAKAWEEIKADTVKSARAMLAQLERETAQPDEQLLVQLMPTFDLEEPFAWMSLPGLPRPWQAEARYVLREGRPVIRDLMIYVDLIDTDGEIPANGLTSSELRRIRTGPDAQRGRELAAFLMERSGVPKVPTLRSRGLPKREPRYTDDDVARVAADYIKAGPKNPRRILLEKYRKAGRHITDDEMAEWIRRCTDRGFLTPAKGPGDRTPRQPTQKLRDWAEEHRPQRKEGRR